MFIALLLPLAESLSETAPGPGTVWGVGMGLQVQQAASTHTSHDWRQLLLALVWWRASSQFQERRDLFQIRLPHGRGKGGLCYRYKGRHLGLYCCFCDQLTSL